MTAYEAGPTDRETGVAARKADLDAHLAVWKSAVRSIDMVDMSAGNGAGAELRCDEVRLACRSVLRIWSAYVIARALAASANEWARKAVLVSEPRNH